MAEASDEADTDSRARCTPTALGIARENADYVNLIAHIAPAHGVDAHLASDSGG